MENKIQRTKLKKLSKSLKEINLSVDMLMDDVHFVSHAYYIKTELDIIKKELKIIQRLVT